MVKRRRKYRVKVKRLIAVWAFTALTLYPLAQVLPGFTIDSAAAAIALAAAIGILNALLWPTLVYLTLPLSVLTLGAFTLVLNSFIIWLSSVIVPGVDINRWWDPLLIAISVSAVNTLLTSLFSIDDDESYYRNVLKKKVTRRVRPGETDVPGVIFLEIDGLAKTVLLRAIRNGHAPTMARWLQDGSHRLAGWECDLSSQTGASQAGILLGNNYNIPAFRWYEKDTGRVIVSSQMSDISEIEERQSSGNGLLEHGGLSLSNMFSGDAPQTVFTMSTVREPKASDFQKKSFYMFFIDPYNFLRAFMLGIWDIFLELRAQHRQRSRDVQPRLENRGLKFALVRAATTTILRELSVYTLIGDMFAGVPSAYVTLFGYDEVAHHSGVERADTLEVLRKLDQQFSRLETASISAPRPYKFVVLSDHGQSQGATFKQRYDITLEELVRQLVEGKAAVEAAGAVAEHWSYLSAPLTDAVVGSQQQVSAKVLRRAVKGKTREGEVVLGPERDALWRKKDNIAEVEREVIVMASGNLGLIYFTAWNERLTMEQIDEAFPGLIRGVTCHPGVGFIMVRSAEHGPLSIGERGIYYLANDRIEGENPLAFFGPNAPAHLRRTDGFPHVADIMVNSFYDPVTDEVAAFEELVGSHGGLGGDQANPFVLFPVEFRLDGGKIVGAEHLNKVLKGWLTQMQGGGGSTGPGAADAGVGA